MAAGQGLDVAAVAEIVLAGVVAHFAASEVTLPDRRVIAPGDPRSIAWDCPQVVVTLGGILWGAGPGTNSESALPTGRPVSSMTTRHAVVAVQIVRCEPVGDGRNPPDPLRVTDAGLALCRDAGLLSQALVELCTPAGPLADYGTALAGAVEVLGPSGGMVGVEGNLTVTAGGLR